MNGRPWVLVTDGGASQSRSALAAVRALGAGGYAVAATHSNGHALAAASRFCNRRVPVPAVGDGDFAGEIRKELRERPYVCVMATSDLALMELAAQNVELLDKATLAERATAAGLPVPPTRVLSGREEALATTDLEYPSVVKPLIQRFPAFLVVRREDLVAGMVEDVPVLVQPYIAERLRAIAGVVWNGVIVAGVHQRYHRTWPPDCGTASAAETVPADEGAEGRLLELLGGYSGIFQAQFAGDFLIDLNLRPYGSLPLAVAAGANLAAVYCDLLRGLDPAPVRARPGVFYRWIEGDLRHLVRRLTTRQMTVGGAIAALKPHRGTAHSTESMLDPKPAIARLAYALQRPS